MLKEGLQGTVAPKAPGTPAWGDRESCLGGGWCSRRAYGGCQFPTARAHQPGGDGKSCPGGGRCSRRAYGGQPLPTARAHQSEGMGSPAQAVVRALGGSAWGSTSLEPGHTILGDGESCRGGGRCSWRACGGQRLPTSRAQHLGGDGKSCPGGRRCSRRACGE